MKAFHPIMRERYREFAIPSAHADHVTKENPFDVSLPLYLFNSFSFYYCCAGINTKCIAWISFLLF